jgi:hypothetical protein
MKIIKILILLSILSGCKESDDINYCPEINPKVTFETSYWDNVNKTLSLSNENNNPVALVCHNCYDNESADTLNTELVIESAIVDLVDIIELDVVIDEVKYEFPQVSHELSSSKVSFLEILSNEVLLQSSTSIFIELKGKITEKKYIRDILDNLMSFESSINQFNYFNEQRIVALRSYEHETTLLTAYDVLKEDKYSAIASYIKLNRIHHYKKQKVLFAEIEQSHECGMDMIELDYRLGNNSIKLLTEYAESLGIAVNVFTLDKNNYESAIKALKNNVDSFTLSSELIDSQEESIYLKARALLNGNE